MISSDYSVIDIQIAHFSLYDDFEQINCIELDSFTLLDVFILPPPIFYVFLPPLFLFILFLPPPLIQVQFLAPIFFTSQHRSYQFQDLFIKSITKFAFWHH